MEKRPENAGREDRARSSCGSRPRTTETGRASRRRAAAGKRGWRPAGWTVFYLIAGGAALLSMIAMIFAEGRWYTFFYALFWGLVGIQHILGVFVFFCVAQFGIFNQNSRLKLHLLIFADPCQF